MYFKDHILGRIRISSLRNSDKYFYVVNCGEEVVQFVNLNGDWTIVGWYKRRILSDKSLLEASKSNVL